MLGSLAPSGRSLLSAGRARSYIRAVRPARSLHASRPVMASKDVMPAEANDLLKSGAYKYLDVRTVDEFKAGHAPGSVNVPVVFFAAGGMAPNPGFLSGVAQVFPNKAESLVVGCKSGRRSLMAIDLLSQAGYTDLVNLAGGFDLWAGQRMPVEA